METLLIIVTGIGVILSFILYNISTKRYNEDNVKFKRLTGMDFKEYEKLKKHK